jgi:hypothetical protein
VEGSYCQFLPKALSLEQPEGVARI